MSDNYRIEIEPDTRMGLFRDHDCLSVTVVRSHPYRWVGRKQTRGRDESEARALAARMVAADERFRSEVTV